MIAAKPCSMPSEEDEGAGGAEAEDTAAVEAAAATSSTAAGLTPPTTDLRVVHSLDIVSEEFVSNIDGFGLSTYDEVKVHL